MHTNIVINRKDHPVFIHGRWDYSIAMLMPGEVWELSDDHPMCFLIDGDKVFMVKRPIEQVAWNQEGF